MRRESSGVKSGKYLYHMNSISARKGRGTRPGVSLGMYVILPIDAPKIEFKVQNFVRSISSYQQCSSLMRWGDGRLVQFGNCFLNEPSAPALSWREKLKDLGLWELGRWSVSQEILRMGKHSADSRRSGPRHRTRRGAEGSNTSDSGR